MLMNVNLFQLSISHLQLLAVINIVTFICSNKKINGFFGKYEGPYLSNVSNFKTN